MQIECTSTSAAAQVARALIDAGLRPCFDFRIDGMDVPNPPIWFIFGPHPPTHILTELQDIPDTRIEKEEAT